MTAESRSPDTHVNTNTDIVLELLESVGTSLSQVTELVEAAQGAYDVGNLEDAIFAATMASAHAQSQTAGLLLQMMSVAARIELLLTQIIINTTSDDGVSDQAPEPA